MIGRLFTAAVALWVALLPAAAYAAGQPAGSRAWHSFALAVYSFGSAICHQRPERSFHLWAAPLPVCARCTGIYVAAAVLAVVSGLSRTRKAPCVGSGLSRILGLPVAFRWGSPMLRLEAPTSDVFRARVFLALAALPAVVSLVYEWTTGEVPSNTVRAATGAVLGGTVAFVVLDSLRQPEAERLR